VTAWPRRGRCARCGHARHLFPHRSVRDGLVRALCVGCFSAASLIEETGHPADFTPDGQDEGGPGHADGAVLTEDGPA
jgi:hypothetical protein